MTDPRELSIDRHREGCAVRVARAKAELANIGAADHTIDMTNAINVLLNDIPALLSHIASQAATIARLRAAALALADAADNVGVQFFDTDTMEPEVEAMQKATLDLRAAALAVKPKETT